VIDIAIWNELTRREQRVLIKMYGGGSISGASQKEIANLRRFGLITGDAKLSAAGLKLFISAYNAQQISRRSVLFT
jgi:hypothetical protein